MEEKTFDIPTEFDSKQQMALDEMRFRWTLQDGINTALDAKAGSLLSAASIILALLGFIGITDFKNTNNPWTAGLAIIAALLFVGMIYLLVWAFLPKKYDVPGTNDWDQIMDLYILVDEFECFKQVLFNGIKTSKRIKKINEAKGDKIRKASCLFMILVALFAIAIIALIIL